MKEERDAVTGVLMTMQHEISRSEFFPAMSETPEKACLNEARKCDIFLGIYKNRYGYVPQENNPSRASVTEMEYDEAKKYGRDRLIFKHSDDKNREKLLSDFLTRIGNFSKGVFIAEFNNPDELKYRVLHALVFHLETVLSSDEIRGLSQKFHLQDPYEGSIHWSAIDYDESERRGYESGIRIGPREIYVRWNELGMASFDVLENGELVQRMSEHMFRSLLRTLFVDEQVYWIEKHMWRISS